MGGTVFVSGAQAVFANRLLAALSIHSPDLDAAGVLEIGATELRSHFPEAVLDGILKSYMIGLKDAFAFGTAVAGCAFLASWIAPIKSIKRAKVAPTSTVA